MFVPRFVSKSCLFRGSIVHHAYKETFLRIINNMQNEIYRKYTSLTLMAIMVAGGLTFAIPGMEPAFAEVQSTNPNLYVSAEGQAPDNLFAEGNIIEVIIVDDSIGDTDEGEAEPEVTVNGADLRMLQAANGDWRAYIAQAAAIAEIDAIGGQLDYGEFCDATAASAVSTLQLSDTNGVYFPPGSSCTDANAGTGEHPLIRETRTLTNHDGNSLGQLGLANDKLWPFIQVFDFAPLSDVDIVYNKGGSQQTVTLVLDDPDESHSLNSDRYPQSAHVLVTIKDYALNIDPTDEDMWAFDTANQRAYYNLFDEDGEPLNINDPVIVDYAGSAGIDEQIDIVRNGQGGAPLIDCQVTKDFGIQQEDNANMDYLETDSSGACVVMADNVDSAAAAEIFKSENFVIGFVEDGSNNDEFINWAEDQRSNLIVRDDAPRDRSFEIDYSSPGAKSGIVSHFFADMSLDVTDAVWNSGERIDFVLTDADANTNPLTEDDLTVANPDSRLIPSIRIGAPITLASATGPVQWIDIPAPPAPDETAPGITLIGGNVTQAEGTPYVEEGAECIDARDGTLVAHPSGNVDIHTVGTYTVEYTCTDAAGNSASKTRTVTITDGTPPIITIDGQSPVTIDLGENYTDAGAICNDPIDGGLVISHTSTVDTTQKGTYTVTYTCTDKSGNEAKKIRNVVVTDSDAPTILITGPAYVEVPLDSTYVDQGAQCTDNADLNPSLTTSDQVDTANLGSYFVTYTCVDFDGNQVSANRFVKVVTPDTTAPTLSLIGQSQVTVLQNSNYTDAGATCKDDRDTDPMLTVSETVDTTSLGTTIITYSCIDASGNSAATVSRAVTVIEPDKIPPIITVDPPAVSVVLNDTYTDMGATCEDETDKSPELMINDTAVNTAVLGNYTVTYTCTDASGNPAQPQSRTVTVIAPDTNPPTIMLNGEQTVSLFKGETYNEMGFRCTDDTDANPIMETTIDEVVNTDVVGNYTVTYTCTDASGNKSTESRTINVTDNLTLLTVSVGEWDDGRLMISVTGKTLLPGVMLESSETIEGLPTKIAAEFGTGLIDDSVTITDISVHGDVEFYLTAEQNGDRVESNTVQVMNIPNALDLTSVMAADNWNDGMLDLEISGTVGVSTVSLVTADGTTVEESLMINSTTGSIDQNVTLTNISLAGKEDVRFKLMHKDVSSIPVPENITAILRLDSVEPAGQWTVPPGDEYDTMTLTIQGSQNATGGDVNLVAQMADGALVNLGDVSTANDGIAVSGQLDLDDITMAGNIDFMLNFTDADGNNAMSTKESAYIPPIVTLTSVGDADTLAWGQQGMALNVTGIINASEKFNVQIAAIDGTDLGDPIDLSTMGAAVLLNDTSYANGYAEFVAKYTDENRTFTSNAVREFIPDIGLQLKSVTAGLWDNGQLMLTVDGNIGDIISNDGSSNVDTAVLLVNGGAVDIHRLSVVNDTTGAITSVGNLTDVAISGMTNFTLQLGDVTKGLLSNTVQADVPPAQQIDTVDITQLWYRAVVNEKAQSPSKLDLQITGYANVSASESPEIFVYPPSGSALGTDVEIPSADRGGAGFTKSVTLGSFDNNHDFAQYSNDNIEIHLDLKNKKSNNVTLTLPSALIFNDLEVERNTLDNLELMPVGASFLTNTYDNARLAIYASEEVAVAGNATLIPPKVVNLDVSKVNPDGSFPISGTASLSTAEDTVVGGMTVYIRLQAYDGNDMVYSDGYLVSLPAKGSGQSAPLNPVPAAMSYSGFPPITKAVINTASDASAIHKVQMTPQTNTMVHEFDTTVEAFSDRLRLAEPVDSQGEMLTLDITGKSMLVIEGWEKPAFADGVVTLFNWNFDSLASHGADITRIYLDDGTTDVTLASDPSGLVDITGMKVDIEALDNNVDLVIDLRGDVAHLCSDITLVADFFTFGQTPDGDRVNNAIYRIEVEEASLDSEEFEGTVEYTMINQLNVDDAEMYANLRTISDEVLIIVHEDFTDEDAVRVNYFDLGADGVSTQIAIQQNAPTHSAVVSFDADNYKIADTVTITVDDADLNVDNDVEDIYIFSTTYTDMIGDDGAFILDVTFDDELWTSGTCNAGGGFAETGFTLMETSPSSGVFTGDFQIPDMYCQSSTGQLRSVTGTDIEVNYQDFRDASGEEIEVGAGAAVRSNTGTVSLDRTVYPVPFGPNVFEDHAGNHLPQGDLAVHIRVNDPDFDISAAGEDVMPASLLSVSVIRGAATVDIPLGASTITEIAPDAGIFELDLSIAYDQGPNGQIQQGDILQVEYTDPTDASGEENTVTDSATFDLRNAVLQSDKSVYLIGSDMILTLIEPDLDLDNDGAETYPLDLIEWDSDAATVAMGSDAAFDPEPNGLRETGDSTGIFQSVIEIPAELDGDRLERGEEIELEYVDHGPSGSDYVGDETEDITLTVFTSNFGATVELDQKVYTWTDKVYITIVAPDHNFDSALIDEIGESDDDPIKVSTRSADIDNYKLVETGPDTGIFTGEVILIGFDHNADGNTETGTENNGYDNPPISTSDDGSGPTNGFIEADDDDGITVSFEFSEDETVVGSALIRWNIGEVQWLEASYPASGTGVVRVIDPDMNLNPEAVDNFEVDVWSDRDAGGIDLTVTETNQATGIFEGTVFFTTADDSSGHRLRVAEGDTVTAEYEDNTLPDPYTTAHELDITATTLIGTQVSPLERAVASNLRIVDAFENSLDTVSVGQQVQIVADLANGQDRTQEFAYLVQIQDASGVTVSLAWIAGTLESEQSLSPSASWIPTEAGTYTATAFVWESVDNPTALSPPVTTTITVN